jgi:hypothetical protein
MLFRQFRIDRRNPEMPCVGYSLFDGDLETRVTEDWERRAPVDRQFLLIRWVCADGNWRAFVDRFH